MRAVARNRPQEYRPLMANPQTNPLAEPPRYCKQCGYSLRALSTPRCPECARPFNPANRRTFRKRPLRPWTRRLCRAAIALTILALPSAMTWGWFYWDWRLEQQALAELKPNAQNQEPRLPHWLDTPTNANAKWLKARLGSAGFVLDRTIQLGIFSPRHSFAPLAAFRRMRDITLDDTNVSDLSPLAGMTDLATLSIDGGNVTDLTMIGALTKLTELNLTRLPRPSNYNALAKLTELKSLYLDHTPITDLSPVARLYHLQTLTLDWTQVTDLRPLAGLTTLSSVLDLRHTPVRDLTPLSALTSLRLLEIDPDVPADQVKALKRALWRLQIPQFPDYDPTSFQL
jgi:hypothetical protein